ncbi:hypothetical protein [Microvirgula aerodenitrificans]|uniref:hypothetical protein n=1 Tax=Microvirgula aerodenitrificans TaxID=57480 RepID=UPI00131EEE44|nr:hypothetical protein [Microvirgula aerodenitrificans]
MHTVINDVVFITLAVAVFVLVFRCARQAVVSLTQWHQRRGAGKPAGNVLSARGE